VGILILVIPVLILFFCRLGGQCLGVGCDFRDKETKETPCLLMKIGVVKSSEGGGGIELCISTYFTGVAVVIIFYCAVLNSN
jgi:hypothetical protein